MPKILTNTLLLSACCLIYLTAASVETVSAADDRPNIVFIMADDKCWSLTGRDAESPKYAYFSAYFGESQISNNQSNKRELR